jgi:hypothetical protein
MEKISRQDDDPRSKEGHTDITDHQAGQRN